MASGLRGQYLRSSQSGTESAFCQQHWGSLPHSAWLAALKGRASQWWGKKIQVVFLCDFHICGSFRRNISRSSAKRPSSESFLLFRRPLVFSLTRGNGVSPWFDFTYPIWTMNKHFGYLTCAKPWDTRHYLLDGAEGGRPPCALTLDFAPSPPSFPSPACSVPIVFISMLCRQRPHQALPH